LLGLLLSCLRMGENERIQSAGSLRKCPAGYGEASHMCVVGSGSQLRDVKFYPTRPSMIVGYRTEDLDIHRRICAPPPGDSSIPIRAALPLHSDACGIADFNPDTARAGSIGTVQSLGNNALGAEPARIGEHGRPIFSDVLVEQDASLRIAQEPRQGCLTVEELATMQNSIMLDQVEA
jgi:hypothetical protein